MFVTLRFLRNNFSHNYSIAWTLMKHFVLQGGALYNLFVRRMALIDKNLNNNSLRSLHVLIF